MKPIHSTSTLLPLLAVLGLLACDTGAQNPPAARGVSVAAAETRAQPLPAEATAGESYVLTVASGPLAGTYRGADELNCMIHDGDWAADFSEERDRGVSALTVTLNGVSESGGTTDDAHLAVLFGRLGEMGGNSGGVMFGGAAGGTARATASREGDDAVMRVEGTTAQGVAVTATIRCRSVS